MNITDISQTTSQQPITGVYWIISIILFGSVIIFVALYIYAFVKGAQTGEMPDILKKEETHEMKKYTRKLEKNVCKYCGTPIDNDSKFCKNCGNRII